MGCLALAVWLVSLFIGLNSPEGSIAYNVSMLLFGVISILYFLWIAFELFRDINFDSLFVQVSIFSLSLLGLCFIAFSVGHWFGLDFVSDSTFFSSNYEKGYDVGYLEGVEAGTDSGYKKGYHQGYNDGCDFTEALYGTIKSASSSAGDISKKSPNSSASSVTWVYITDTGSKYHKAGCAYLKSSNEISLSDAIAWGYEPCSRCY